MTVKELIEALKRAPEEASVVDMEDEKIDCVEHDLRTGLVCVYVGEM